MLGSPRPHRGGFTLIELLVVISIIAILAAITFMAGEGVMKAGARSRAKAEIAAMSAALEAYKNDNGVYPQVSILTPLTNYKTVDPTIGVGGEYQTAATSLYAALAGKPQYIISDPTLMTGKIYMNFTSRELGNWQAAAGANTFVQDPFGNPYGYSTGLAPVAGAAGISTDPPVAGQGMFDLWSTGGATPTSPAVNWTNSWLPELIAPAP